jgi:signal peptide peptidase SppA
MKYIRIIAEFQGRLWAMRHETLCAMRNLLLLQAQGIKWSDEEIAARIDESNRKNGHIDNGHVDGSVYVARDSDTPGEPEARRSGNGGSSSSGSVAVIPITGVISYRMNMMGDISGPGGTSIQKLTSDFRAALEDGNCKGIVFDVDSPGGSVDGVMELAAEIYAARGKKPITAVCNSMAASAAYWLACAAEDLVCIPSGQVGSIGVYVAHQDESEALKKEGLKISFISAGAFKTEGNSAEPLGEEARTAIQDKVNAIYGRFIKDVATYRGDTQAKVRDGYGQGRMLLAADALKQNMIDRVATFDDVLKGFGVSPSAQRKSMAAAAPPSLQARADGPPNDDELDEDNYCDCSCEACKACSGMKSASKAESGDGCMCACEACKACDMKGAANSHVPELPAVASPIATEAAGAHLRSIQDRTRELALLRLSQ